MCRYLILVIAVTALGCGEAPDPEPDASESDLKRMQGTWVLDLDRVGFKNPKPNKVTIEVKQNELRTSGWPGQEQSPQTFRLNAKKAPAEIDLRPEEGDGRTRGIYRFSGGVLTIAFFGPGEDRPERFDQVPTDRRHLTVWVLRRDTK